MIEVIKEKTEWNEQVALSENHDVYHTYDYHHITKKTDEIPILIKYTDGANFLLLPLLIRPIEYSHYKDAISVYGYAGILSSTLNEYFNKESFHNELNTFFKEQNIISVFSRFHPFLEHQEAALEGLGTIVNRGKVVYIALSETLENQRKMYHRRMKTYLNKSRRTCSVVESNSVDDLDTFINLYHENMNRVGADSSYFFSKKYFQQLLSSDDFTAKLVLCIHNETQRIIAGALFMEKGECLHYHLSGLNEKHSDLNAIKLIIDEMGIKATMQGLNYLNLGGGRGSEEDSLFNFKASFSKNFKEFKIWKYIVDQDAYRMLVEKHLESPLETVIENIGFFPAYRSRRILNP